MEARTGRTCQYQAAMQAVSGNDGQTGPFGQSRASTKAKAAGSDWKCGAFRTDWAMGEISNGRNTKSWVTVCQV